MLYAILNNEKIPATPKALAKCPLCQMEVFSKCGEINIWHWSHKKHESCDNWYEPETQWHLNWKEVFGKDRTEIVIIKDGIKHFADIQSENYVIIELQNSPLKNNAIRQREEFYGERMLWVINGTSFIFNFRMYEDSFLKDWMRFQDGYVNLKTGEFQSNIVIKRNIKFEWSYARKSWQDANRPIFIDFGGDSIFRVLKGMGTSSGIGIKVKKSSFVQKYKGDLSKLHLITDLNKKP